MWAPGPHPLPTWPAQRGDCQHRVLETVRIVSDIERLASAMARANTESARARLIRHRYSRGHDEARAQMREAFNLPGDLEVAGATPHVLLDSTTPDIVRSFSQSTAIRQAPPRHSRSALVLMSPTSSNDTSTAILSSEDLL